MFAWDPKGTKIENVLDAKIKNEIMILQKNEADINSFNKNTAYEFWVQVQKM